jgi:hypothetical protein
MSPNAFKPLAVALSQSPDWAPIDRAWRETEGLTEALKAQLPGPLFAQVVQVRRGDPTQGIRGSLVTVIAKNAAAAAKLRLALADWDRVLRATGWGIAQIKIVEQRQQGLGLPEKTIVHRGPIPEQAKAAFRSLAVETQNEALRSALARLANRVTKSK